MGTVELLIVLTSLARQRSGIDDDILLVVDDSVKLLCRKSEQITYLIGQGTEIPDVGHGNHQFNMAATLTAHFLLGHLNATTVADNALVAYALVLAACALIVTRRTKDALAEQTVTLRLIGAVVDGFGLGNLAPRILQNLLRRGETNGDLREIAFYFIISFESHRILILI